jgi:serine protease Do
MKRNAVAWAALVLSVAALVGSRNFTKPAPAAQEIPAEGQKAAKALSAAFEAVADFAKPSVVQISVQKKGGGLLDLFGGNGRGGRMPFNGPGRNPTPRELRELRDFLKRMDPDLKDDQLDEKLKKFTPDGSKGRSRDRDRDGDDKPSIEREQFGFRTQGTGSGFVYDDKGHILTNNHVVEDAEQIEVTFYDGDTAKATVVGRDPGSDVAVIKVDNTSYRPLPRGNSKDLRVGEWVMAIGSPFGLSQTVTAGIISATERSVGETTGQPITDYEAFIQTDVAINPGNSGGPLVDMNGRVVGVNSAIATSTRSYAGVGFAIPIDLASHLAEKLIKDGKISRVRIGVGMKPLTPALARELHLDKKTRGVLVDLVAAGSPADKAGLKKGDIITAFDNQPVFNPAAFKILVSTSETGRSHELKYLRDGREQTARITPAPEEQVRFAFEPGQGQAPRERDGSRRERAPGRGDSRRQEGFGLSVETLTSELAKKYGYPEGTEGAVITDVEEDSPAEAAGLEKGDVITKVVLSEEKIEAVKSAKDFRDLARKADQLAIFVKDVRNPKKAANLVTLSKADR